MDNNNAYIKIKVAQLEARLAVIEAEAEGLYGRIESYKEQLVDEPEIETQPEDPTED